MKLSELKNEIKALGFEYTFEDENLVDFAITRALRLISTSIPVIGRYELDGEQGQSYDLSRLATRFGRITDVVERTGSKPFSDYELEQDRIFIPNKTGSYTIFYKEQIVQITKSTSEDSELQCDYRALPLVSLLASHYVWLDDDAVKATMYYNEYEQNLERIVKDYNRPKLRIVGGFKWL